MKPCRALHGKASTRVRKVANQATKIPARAFIIASGPVAQPGAVARKQHFRVARDTRAIEHWTFNVSRSHPGVAGSNPVRPVIIMGEP